MILSKNLSEVHLVSVIGISMGDEGKGRVVHEVLKNEKKCRGISPIGVMKVNGGANAGHTAAGLKLNLLPSGVGDPEVETLLIGSGVVADPRKFLWEAKPLEERGIKVMNRLLIDKKTQVSDLSHRLLDLAWENYRVKQLGLESRGSTGRGISPAYCDETGQWQIFYQSFLQDRKAFAVSLGQRCQRALDCIRWVCKVSEEDWFGFFETLSSAEKKANETSIEEGFFDSEEFCFKRFLGQNPFELNMDEVIDQYWQAGRILSDRIGDVRDFLLDSTRRGRTVVAEFGQAYWLDKRHGFTPNVTASHTTGAELFLSGGIPLQPMTEIGCCKAYDTKVGTHHFITQIDHLNDPWGKKLAKLEFGTSTGRQRMVGWFDAVEKGNALRYGGFDQIVINKLDALTLDPSVPSEIKLCVAYQLPNGEITRDVPRDESLRMKLKPVWETHPGWKEDLRGVRSFHQLPDTAQSYVARMISSIVESAYPNGFSRASLPEIRFIGIGPDPGEVISDAPSTRQLLQTNSRSNLSVAS